MPKPAVYGVYAIHGGQLIELNPVATAPVDPRLKTVVQITQPSVTRLATGLLKFVVYRRDLIVGAPEKVSIRVVATLARATKFDGAGTVVTVPQRETWIIRSSGYDFRVLPVSDDREMIIVRPEDPEFAVPSGRYALMLNAQPYDFVVEGPVSNEVHLRRSRRRAVRVTVAVALLVSGIIAYLVVSSDRLRGNNSGSPPAAWKSPAEDAGAGAS